MVSAKIVANFHLNPYVRPTTGLHQDVPNPIMAGDHITTIFAGNCMVAKVIKCTTWAQCTLGALQGVKSKPCNNYNNYYSIHLYIVTRTITSYMYTTHSKRKISFTLPPLDASTMRQVPSNFGGFCKRSTWSLETALGHA